MTLLSLLLWAIDAAATLKIVLTVAAILGLSVFGIVALAIFIIEAQGYRVPPILTTFKLKRWIILSIVAGFFAAVIPSKTTMYMITGVEIANSVVTNEYSKEILSEIKDVVIDKIKETNIKDAASTAASLKKISE